MAATYKLDTVTVNQDPIRQTIPIQPILDTDHAGTPLMGAYYSTTLSFSTLNAANYTQWKAACDGAVHSIYMPAIANPSSYATYSGVFLKLMSGDFSTGIYAYDVQIEVTHIS